jgi:thiaminase/transcriptional activator TenA
MVDFLTQLREECDPIWRRIYSHPFIRELTNGTLPQDKLKVYIQQDYLYLIEFAKCCALAAARSSNPVTAKVFVKIAHQTFEKDLNYHRRLSKALGMEEKDLDEAKPLPTCFAYTNYMFGVAASGSSGEVAASLCPCLWTYLELGGILGPAIRKRVTRPDDALWSYYSAGEYKAIVDAVMKIISDSVARASEEELERMRKHFKIASEYEYMFWDMAYGRKEWGLS